MFQMAGNKPMYPIPDPSAVPKLKGNNQAKEQLELSDFTHRPIKHA